jgi:hypothetical protein
MRADNSRHLITAARHRAAATRKRAAAALRRMDKAGTRITVDAVAKEAQGLPVLALQPARPAGRGRTPPRPTQPSVDRPTGSRPATRLRRLVAAATGVRDRTHPAAGGGQPATPRSAGPRPRGAPNGRHPRQHPRHADQEICPAHRTLLTTTSTTPSSSHHRRSTQRSFRQLKIRGGNDMSPPTCWVCCWWCW